MVHSDDDPKDEDYSPDEHVPVQSAPQQKRKYTMKNRTPGRPGKSVTYFRWINDTHVGVSVLPDRRCCKKLNCFSNANPRYLAEK